LIGNPHLNFILTGSGTAYQLQHIILLFLAHPDPDIVWILELFALNQASVNLYRVTVTWRQVDTPSLASFGATSSDYEAAF
jgi:hypothetical protein